MKLKSHQSYETIRTNLQKNTAMRTSKDVLKVLYS